MACSEEWKKYEYLRPLVIKIMEGEKIDEIQLRHWIFWVGINLVRRYGSEKKVREMYAKWEKKQNNEIEDESRDIVHTKWLIINDTDKPFLEAELKKVEIELHA